MVAGREAEIVLVRAVEETCPEAIPPEVRAEAAAAAGELEEERAWLGRRASYLLEHGLAGYRPLLSLGRAFGLRALWVVGVPFTIGLLTNYLGPTRQIHVLYNPIAALIVWNLGVYVVTGLRGLFGNALSGALPRPALGDVAMKRPAARATKARPGLLSRLLLRRLLPAFWLRLQGAAGEAREQGVDLARVGRAFWTHWLEIAGPLFSANFRRMLHVAAIGIALGGVVGMFVRGLFFDYDMVWRSTFVETPATVATLLRILPGPAALILGQPLPDEAAARALLTPDGVGAAGWIWLWAVSALIFVALPRTLLALHASWRLRSIGRDLDLRVDAPYYEEILQPVRARQVERIAEAIKTDVRIESGKFAESLAIFVGSKLYDERIVPHIEQFREQGGSLADLEAEVRSECQGFQAELVHYVPVAQREFERSVSGAIERTLDVHLPVTTEADEEIAKRAEALSAVSARAASAPIERELTTTIGTAVATAVAAVTGTVSGGFGQTIGTAVLVGLLHTTGPLAFVVGALAGLVLALGVFWLGRERLTDGIKQLSLPGAVVRATLWKGRLERLIDDGRARCREVVRELMDAELEPLTPAIAERIWNQVKPILAEKQRGP
jgi:hypothetical protein